MKRIIIWLTLVAALSAACGRKEPSLSPDDQFVRLLNVSKGLYDKGEPDKAIVSFQSALKIYPTNPDVHLNLANAYLRSGRLSNALAEVQEVLHLSKRSAAAFYIRGCANFRAGKIEEALQDLQQAQDADPSVAAAAFQVGRAHQSLGQWAEAAAAFQLATEIEPDHPSAHYALSQALIRLNKNDEANKELDIHRAILARRPNIATDPTNFELCKHTEIRIPILKWEQPAANGVKVKFADGGQFKNFHGPVGVIDLKHDGHYSLIAAEGDQGFRLLTNFKPQGELLKKIPGAIYSACLVGDLNNDRVDDFVLLSNKGTQVFLISSNGVPTEITATCGLRNVKASAGVLADLDFTGKLGLITDSGAFRNQGNLTFVDNTKTAGLAGSLAGASQLIVDDWDSDDLPDLFVAGGIQPPRLFLNQRGGPVIAGRAPKDWPSGTAIAVGDLNNDLRTDIVVVFKNEIEIVLSGIKAHVKLPLGSITARTVALVDYDNDGWLDIVVGGDFGLKVFRNLGEAGFRDVTSELGMDKLFRYRVLSVTPFDFDGDGDTDLLVDFLGIGLQLLRNDGGNANRQLKFILRGKRSNASGLGARVELAAGGWRAIHTAGPLPLEIGVGQHAQIDVLTTHWYDLRVRAVEVKADPRTPIILAEIELPTGSCPYLYAWDGTRFRFVTDLLGAAPLGLPVAEGHLIDADTDELVWIGNETNFQPRAGNFILQISEELREVLYLDEAKLLVVDHPAGTEAHPTSKLRPGKPFAPPAVMTLGNRVTLLHAERSDGADVTATLAEADGKVVSPVNLRAPQLRGLAEPFSVTLDFGSLEKVGQTSRLPNINEIADETSAPHSMILALTGWLRFGGGMANIAASHNPGLPFPFPSLEVESSDGAWRPVDVVVGAPAGKTKTILVDLTGKLPAGSRRLRLTTAFEIHWDRIAMFGSATPARRTGLAAATAHLHWRGFSEFAEQPWFAPLTPEYERANANPNWRITPSGWCTRYGDVGPLLGQSDDALVLLNGGDELTLQFAADGLPVKPVGSVRDYFLFTSGWDKDADYHVTAGDTVEPLPWHGLDDQLYGKQPRPTRANDTWIRQYNTRWVGPMTIDRAASQR